MDPRERLLKIDKTFVFVRTSPFVYFFPLFAKLTSHFVGPLGKFCFKNHHFGIGLTNICGPRVATTMGGYGTNITKVNAAVGPYDGVVGN